MSEEEKLIDYLNSIDITRIFYDNPPHENHVGIGGAIQGLLDLYNKEKEKNKKIEETVKKGMKNLWVDTCAEDAGKYSAYMSISRILEE